MAETLEGKRVAFVTANEGVEQVELTEPWKALQAAGAMPRLLAPEETIVDAFNHLDRGEAFAVDGAIANADVDDFDALVLPGGVANADTIRADEDAVRLTRAFFEAGKPVGVICHGPWLLIEADVVRGRKLTSWPSLQTDIRNAGGEWVDEQVCVDSGLVTSRKPDDLPAFCSKLIEEIAEGRHDEQRAKTEAAAGRA